MSIDIINNSSKSQFEAEVEQHLAIIRYTLAGKTLTLTHTEVPDELGGKGVGSLLVRTALDYARKEELNVVPVCPFVVSYIDRHEEYMPLVAKS